MCQRNNFKGSDGFDSFLFGEKFMHDRLGNGYTGNWVVNGFDVLCPNLEQVAIDCGDELLLQHQQVCIAAQSRNVG